MLLSVKLENEFGKVLEVTNNPNYILTDIEGLGPAKAAISTSSNGIFDGSRFTSSKVGNRNIVITLALEQPVEENRIKLYKYAAPKRPVRFYLENDSRNVFIDGYVEACEVNPFSKRTMVQISIICPQPFFSDIKEAETKYKSIVNLFEFPFDNPIEGMPFGEILREEIMIVNNEGDVETGGIFELCACGTVSRPVIYNADTLERFSLNLEMRAGDKLTINTKDMQKAVVLEREGVKINVVNMIQKGAAWLRMPVGTSRFVFEPVYGENFCLTIRHNNLYQGV